MDSKPGTAQRRIIHEPEGSGESRNPNVAQGRIYLGWPAQGFCWPIPTGVRKTDSRQPSREREVVQPEGSTPSGNCRRVSSLPDESGRTKQFDPWICACNDLRLINIKNKSLQVRAGTRATYSGVGWGLPGGGSKSASGFIVAKRPRSALCR